MADTNAALTRYLWHRVVNCLRAEAHFFLSHLGIVRFSHLPVFVSIEPADFCNLHCPECPVGNKSLQEGQTERKAHLMPEEIYRRVLQEIQEFAQVLQFYFQGEPTLHPALANMIQQAHDVGLYTIVSTNAQNISPAMAEQLISAGLSRIIVSIDGLSEHSYQAYRQGGSLKKAFTSLHNLHEAKQLLKGKTHIELQCLRLKSNEHEWQRFMQEYKQLGADSLTFKTAQLYDYQHGHPLMPSILRYSRYRKCNDGCYHLYRPWWRTKICHRIFTGCVIDTQGNMLPCCFDKQRQHPFGNIMKQPLKDIWQSALAQIFRRQVLSHREQVAICQNCTE